MIGFWLTTVRFIIENVVFARVPAGPERPVGVFGAICAQFSLVFGLFPGCFGLFSGCFASDLSVYFDEQVTRLGGNLAKVIL